MVNVAAFLERDTGFQFFYVDLAAGCAQVISNLNSVHCMVPKFRRRVSLRPAGPLTSTRSARIEIRDFVCEPWGPRCDRQQDAKDRAR